MTHAPYDEGQPMMVTPASRDIETDVIVVGYGYAGASAAISAHDAGSDVVILEKMARPGGNSRVSGGICAIPRPTADAIRGFSAYLKALCFGTTPPDLVDALVAESLTLVDWLAELGGGFGIPDQVIASGTYPCAKHGPAFPGLALGAGTFDFYRVRDKAGASPALALWNLLADNVTERAIDVRLGAAAEELLTDDGAVTGVAAVIDGTRVVLRARKAVVMTCGGFENDAFLKADNFPPMGLGFAGTPGNTGDGIRMVQKIGGAMWHMTRASTVPGFQAPGFEAAFGIFLPGAGFIYTDKYSRRFVNETGIEMHDFGRVFAEFDAESAEFPRIPVWAVFTEEVRQAGPITWPCGYNQDVYTWSADNSAEIERGWIVRADSVAELAERLGGSAQVLEETLATYNSACVSGADPAFGRSSDTLTPVHPPYYAIPMHPVVLNTQGGAKRDARAQIVDARGEPIPRLYSAGEFGSIWGYLYQGSSNITECLAVGRIAGRNAASTRRSFQ